MTSTRRRIARLLVLVICVCCLPRMTRAADDEADFTVVSYNVNYGNADLRAVVEAIEKCGADVVALQETNRESEAFLRRKLKRIYPHMTFRRARAAGGFAVLSKTPIEKTGYLPPLREAGGWFGTQTACVTIDGRQVLLVNVHLTATVPQQGMDLREATALFLKTEAVREKEVRNIVAQLPERWPVIVLGDFNSIPTLSSVPAFMTRSGFTDCISRVIENADAVPTWHWEVKGVERELRLDYIFCARLNAEPASGRVERTGGSDHFPVVCAFKWEPLPVSAGEVKTQARTVAYLVDAFGMTPEALAAARELVVASTSKLAGKQFVCVASPERRDVLVPAAPAPATEANRDEALAALPEEAPERDRLLPAIRKAMDALKDEADPKVLVIVSDRLAADPRLLKSVDALRRGSRLQFLLVDGNGKAVAVPEESD